MYPRESHPFFAFGCFLSSPNPFSLPKQTKVSPISSQTIINTKPEAYRTSPNFEGEK
jgi:hypothetical protein